MQIPEQISLLQQALKNKHQILSLKNGHWAIFREVNVAGRGVEHQLPSSAYISNESCYSPTPPLCLLHHGTCSNFRVSKIFLSLASNEERVQVISGHRTVLLDSGGPIISQCVFNYDKTCNFLKPVKIIIYRRRVSD
jgi:hypothetical protein